MSFNPWTASAPGSLMLLGEYAVLYGKKAIVCAIDKRIHVTLQPRRDEQLMIHSALGEYTASIHHITMEPPLQFVLGTLQSHRLPQGCEITITAEFAGDLGLGSSAAVTVALSKALNQWLQRTLSQEQLWRETKAIMTRVQGNGSGADLAASIYGGTLAFQNNPLQITPLQYSPQLCVIYSGKKTITTQAIHIVAERREKNPKFFQQLDKQIHQISMQAIPAINQQNWKTLGALFNEAQTHMNTLGVSNTVLEDIIQTLRRQPTVCGAKISGSGLGDCVIGLGYLENKIFPQNEQQHQLGVTQLGVTIDAH